MCKCKNKKLEIRIKYSSPDLKRIEKLKIGDWFDLRASETIVMKKGEFKLIPLGVAMELPKGYEAHALPRSSTFKNFKITLVNSEGIIDNTYKGDNDWWFFPALAHEDTTIHFNDRICQFRIVEKQPEIDFVEVKTLNNQDRGGLGSTGTK